METREGTRKRQNTVEIEDNLKRKYLGPQHLECSVVLNEMTVMDENEDNSSEEPSNANMNEQVRASVPPKDDDTDPMSNDSAEQMTEAIDQNEHNPSEEPSNANLNEQVRESAESNDSAGQVVIVQAGMQVQYEWKPSGRKNQMILYTTAEKQRYKKNKYNSRKKYQYMTCCDDGCKAGLYLYDDGICVFANSFTGHTHVSTQEDAVAVASFKEGLKQECAKLATIGGRLPSVKDIFDKQSEKLVFST